MFTNYCKICGVSHDETTNKFFPLLDNQDVVTKLGSMFFDCIFPTTAALSQPQPISNMPAYLCEPCQLKLIEFHQFREMALNTHRTILEFLKNSDFLKALTQDQEEAESDRTEIMFELVDLKNEYVIDDIEDEEIIENTSDSDYYRNESLNSVRETEAPFEFHNEEPANLPINENIHSLAEISRVKEIVNSSFICKICGKHLLSDKSLNDHKSQHIGFRPYKCEFCGKGFKSDNYLQNHISEHDNIKNFPCHICGLEHPSKFNLRDHMETHATEPFYQCYHCSMKLKTSKTLIQHIETAHLNAGNFICRYCTAGFGSKKHLMNHFRRHLDKGDVENKNIKNLIQMREPIKSQLRIRSNLLKVYGKNDKIPNSFI